MAMSDRVKKSNLCYLLIKGGTPVCRALFKKRVMDLKPKEEDSKTWTVNKFLQLKRPQLESKLGYKKTIVFPRDQQTVKVGMWDVRLLCVVLSESCEPSPVQRLCLKVLQEQRKKITHLIDTDIDDCRYEECFEILKDCIQILLSEAGDEQLEQTIEEMISQMETGIIPHEELMLVQHTLLLISKDFTQKIRNQHDKTRKAIEKGNPQLTRFLDTLYREHEEVERSNQEILRHSQVADQVQNPPQEIPIEIRFLNCVQASEEVVELFNKDIESNPKLPTCKEDMQDLSKAVNDFTTELKDKGCTITKADVGCIVLRFQCSSILSLLTLLRDYVNGSLDKSLTKLEQAVQSLDGSENIHLEAVLYEDDYLKILSDNDFEQFVTKRQTSTEQTEHKNLKERHDMPKDKEEAKTLMKIRAVENTAANFKKLDQDVSKITLKREQLQEVPWWKQLLRSWIPIGSSDSASHNIEHEQKEVPADAVLPTRIKITGLPENIDEETLESVFENTKRHGGGKVKNVSLDIVTMEAIVEFEEPASVEIVMGKQPTKLLRREVCVTVYTGQTREVGDHQEKESGNEDFTQLNLPNDQNCRQGEHRYRGSEKLKVRLLETQSSEAEGNFVDVLENHLKRRDVCLEKISVQEFSKNRSCNHLAILVCNHFTRLEDDIRNVLSKISSDRHNSIFLILLLCKRKLTIPLSAMSLEVLKPVAYNVDMTFNTDDLSNGLDDIYNNDAFQKIFEFAKEGKFDCKNCKEPDTSAEQ